MICRTKPVALLMTASKISAQPCAPGDPLTGKQPFGLAVEPRSNGLARLFVGSFDRSWVNVIDVDPLRPTLAPASWARIGPERP